MSGVSPSNSGAVRMNSNCATLEQLVRGRHPYPATVSPFHEYRSIPAAEILAVRSITDPERHERFLQTLVEHEARSGVPAFHSRGSAGRDRAAGLKISLASLRV